MKIAQILYQSPDNWGETTYGTQEFWSRTIPELRKIDSDWEDINLRDCTEWKIITKLSKDSGLYQCLLCPHIEYQVFEYFDGGQYHRIGERIFDVPEAEAVALVRR